MIKDHISFLNNVKGLCEEKGLKYSELSYMVGISPNVLKYMELRLPALPRIYTLARFFDVGVSRMFLFENKNTDHVYGKNEFCLYMINAGSNHNRIRKTNAYAKFRSLEIPRMRGFMDDFGQDIHLLPEFAEFKCPSFVYEERTVI